MKTATLLIVAIMMVCAVRADNPLAPPGTVEFQELAVRSSRQAIAKWPGSEDPESPMGKAIDARRKYYMQAKPAFFSTPDWPMRLATEIASEQQLAYFKTLAAADAAKPSQANASTNEFVRLSNESAEYAVKMFPDLQKNGSPFQEEFTQRFRALQANNPDFFRDPGWVLILAQQVDHDQRLIEEGRKSQPTSKIGDYALRAFFFMIALVGAGFVTALFTRKKKSGASSSI